MNILSLKRNY